MLETLLNKIQEAPDFPAFSRTVQEVGALIADEDQRSINDLCSLILRDVALTRKVLAVANTFSVREARGTVHTVSRAVMLLGFEEVKEIALTLMLFEHLQGQDHAGRLRGRMLQALFGALLAQSLSRPMVGRGGEPVFLAALFQNLGPMLVYRHLPEAPPEIERLCQDEGLDERAAILRATGIVADHLGREVAARWGLPDSLRADMRPVPLTARPGAVPPVQQAAWVASFANAGTAILLTATSSAKADAALDELARRGGIEPEAVHQALAEARERMGIYVGLFEATDGARGLLARLGGQLPEAVVLPEAPAAASPTSGSERLLRGIEDVTASLLEDYALPELLSSILETLYQGLDLALAVFFVHDARSRTLRPSMAFGEHSAKILKGGMLSLDSSNPIVTSLQGGEDRLIRRRDAPAARMEPWQWGAAESDTALIYPVYVNRRPVALFYAEGRGANMPPEALKVVKTLRNQAALAVMNKSARA